MCHSLMNKNVEIIGKSQWYKRIRLQDILKVNNFGVATVTAL